VLVPTYVVLGLIYVVLVPTCVVPELSYVVLRLIYVALAFYLQNKKAMSQPSSAEPLLKIKSVGYNKTYRLVEIEAFAPTSQPPKKVLLTDKKAGLLARASSFC